MTLPSTFSVPCKRLDYADYLVNFELFFRDICNLDSLSNEDFDFAKAKTKEVASYRTSAPYSTSYYRTYSNNVPQNFLMIKS